jgi:hypothetical protein
LPYLDFERICMISSNIRMRTRACFSLAFAFASIVFITVAFASGNPAPAAHAQAPTTAPGPTAAPVATTLPVGPIVLITTASSVDDQGNLVDPQYTFEPSQPQIAAIVRVGRLKSANSPLTVTWYHLNEDDVQEKLFEQQIAVQSDDLAYSIAKNPGTLTEGTYQVSATLEGQTTQSPLSVRTKNTSSAPPGAAPAGQAPTPGGSGTYHRPAPAPPSAAASVPGCRVDLDSGEMWVFTRDFRADLVEVSFGGRCYTTALPMSLFATVQGPLQHIADYRVDVGQEGTRNFWVDPCTLSSGSDLPGTQVQFTAEGELGTPSYRATVGALTLTLDRDTLAPHLEVHSSPAKGTKVKVGDKIEVNVTATEQKRLGPWQMGVHSIQVISPNAGGVVGEPWTNPERLPKPCAAKTWAKDYHVTYTVPPNPPATIQLCAIADDYAPNESSKCANYPTGEVTLRGNYEYSWDYDVKNMPWHFGGLSTATFTAQAGEGNSMTGTALVHWTGTGKGSDAKGQCAWTFSTGDISWSVDLKGTFQKNADGSSSVFLMPTPVQGPLGPPPVGGCPNSRPPDRITTAAFSVYGTLVNGHLDTRLDLPFDGQGYNRLVTHIELVPNK